VAHPAWNLIWFVPPIESGQYTSSDFTDVLAANEMIQSLSPAPPMLGQRRRQGLVLITQARADRPALVGHPRSSPHRGVREHRGVRHRRRLHSSLNYMTPAEYETTIRIRHDTAAHAA